MVYKLNSQAHATKSGKTIDSVILALVQQNARDITSGVTALTDSSGGTAGTVTAASVALVNEANASTNLAQKAATEAALTTVLDALVELYAKANEYAVKVGLDQITYSGGGAAADGTVAAVTVAVTAAATGVQAASVNASLAAINAAIYKVTVLTNRIAVAQGKAEIANITGQTYSNTVAAISVDGGTAASPGVTKAAVDAELVKLRANVATLATKLNTFNDGVTAALVVAV